MEMNDRFVLLCAGLNRSGSTWQMNLARDLIQQSSPQINIYTSWVEDYCKEGASPVHLIKAHKFTDAAGIEADVILSTYRDIRAVAGSMVRMRWTAPEWNAINTFLDQYVEDCACWEQHADLVLPYETIIESPVEAAMAVARTLGLTLPEEAIASAVQRVGALRPKGKFVTGTLDTADPTTFLHDGHVGDVNDDAAMMRLPEDILARIEAKHHDWLVGRGYAPSLERLANLAQHSLAFDRGPAPILTGVPLKFSDEAPAGFALFGLDTEAWGAWSVGPMCGIAFHVPAMRANANVIFRAGALTPEGAPPVCATAFLNGKVAGSWTWFGAVDHKEIRISLPASGTYVLCFLVHGARSPRSLGIGTDEREIGLAFHEAWVEVQPIEASEGVNP